MLRTTTATTALLAVAGFTAAADAGIFSFASDFSDQSWTFKLERHADHFSISDATHYTDPTVLLIDDVNGNLDPLEYVVDFNLDADLDFVSSTPIGGGKFIHSYTLVYAVAGWYTSSGPVLEMTFRDSIITIVGDEFGWDSAGSMFGSDAWADVQYTSYIDEPDYGMYVGDAIGPQDFGFSLTAINTSGSIPYDYSSPGAILDPSDMLPTEEVFAEGSFSGSAQFIPAPSTAALLLGAGLLSTRRRR